MKKIELKTFSIKKLLVTILYTVIISVFIGTTALFLLSIPETIQLEMVNSMDKDSETMINNKLIRLIKKLTQKKSYMEKTIRQKEYFYTNLLVSSQQVELWRYIL